VLDHHALEDVRHVLATIGGILEEIKRFLPLHDRQRVVFVVEQPADRLLMNAVRFILETVDLDGVAEDAFVLLERIEGEPDLVGGRSDDLGQLARAEPDRVQPVEADECRRRRSNPSRHRATGRGRGCPRGRAGSRTSG